MSRGADETALADQKVTNEKVNLNSEDGSGSRKGRGLLNVPSRSSSQKVQQAPSTAGLSGATVSDPRDSIGGQSSKESRNSKPSRHHDGSASSNQNGAVTGPTATPNSSSPNSPAAAPQRKKKGGFLSFLGCCGVPDNANALDGGEEPLPSHKLDKIPPRPMTAGRRTITPSEQTTPSKSQLLEKESQSTQDASKSTKRASASTAQEQSIMDTESKQTTLVGASGPSITVNPPLSEDPASTSVEAPFKDGDSDVDMTDAQPAAIEQTAPSIDEQYSKPMPPPPPGPIPAPSVPTTSQEETEVATTNGEQQKWLLPPIEPRFKGKKCLVLDLDETLVHSSFKVCTLHSICFCRSFETNWSP